MAHLQNVNQLWKLLLLKVTINEKSLNVVRAETPPLDSAAARLVKRIIGKKAELYKTRLNFSPPAHID